MPARITVVGSANTDMVVRVPQLPAPGATVLGSEFVMAAGGKGANQAVAAARLGAQTHFVARLGRDSMGRAANEQYVAEGLNVEHLAWDEKAASGVALIMVDARGENVIAVAPGANSRLSSADLRAAEPALAICDCLLLQLEIPLGIVRVAAVMGRKHGARIILNPAPAVKLPDSLLSLVDVITPNQGEAARLTGLPVTNPADAQAAVQALHALCGAAVVMTLGADGALVAAKEGFGHVPGFAVQAVDTTAAGDAFNGALAVALAEGRALPDAVRFANAAGALAATRLGAQPSLPTRAEVEALLAGQAA